MNLLPLVAAVMGVFWMTHSVVVAAAARPNIILILADDMGFSDIGCYGSEIQTPNLDALAASGVRFTQFYNTARCCPTRASLLTGLHPHQAGVGHMMEDRGYDGYRGNLNRHCVTIAEALKPAGYRSYAVGKWHVTPGHTATNLADQRNWPLQRGFERYYGTIHGAGSYWDPSALVRDNRQITVANDPEYRPKEFYYTDAISDHAVKFIRDHARDHRAEPFFLYAAFTAAHWPMHAKESDIAKYHGRYDAGYATIRQARWEKQKQLGVLDPNWQPVPIVGDWAHVTNRAFEARCMEVYAAMVDCLDQGIGRVAAELKQQGLFDNTLILFLQDNGGCAELVGRGTNATVRGERPSLPPMGPDDFQFNSIPKQTRDGWPVRMGYGVMPGGPDTYVAYGREWANVSNTPFREYKHWTHEGGISTPLIAHWPAGIEKDAKTRGGRLVKEPGQLPDIMATCLEVAGADYPTEFHGERIKPLAGRSLVPLFSASSRLPLPRLLYWEHEGNRAIRAGKWKLVAKENQPWELYDLEADRTELHDLASAEPERVKTMAAAWDVWAARSDVLPLGAWRGKEDTLNKEQRFVLKAGDRLPRGKAPAIARRAFTITAKIDTGPATNGVIVAQGGSALGYSLYLAEGRLHFMVRTRGRNATASTPDTITGAHTVVARLDAKGTLTLTLDGEASASANLGGLVSGMPVDGLEVGQDSGGAVGSYRAPNPFSGSIQSVTIELDAQDGAAAPSAGQRQNKPEIPEVPRADVICFAYYTVNQGVLKLTAQLYPLKDDESRAVKLEAWQGNRWTTLATTRVTEEPYNNYRHDKTWTAHFRVGRWDEARTVPYRVTALDGRASYGGVIRANPIGKREIVVAAFTGNSNQDRRLKPDMIANLKAQDPDLLFFSGDQSYDHVDHLGAWLLFGRQFGEIIKDRPMISIPDDHDIGQANLWGAGGKVSTNAAGDDGGYFMPVEYVKAVERAQTWHLPDPVDPAPIERGIGVYFTALNWGGISFAILEDRKFKTGPNGPLQLKPKFAPRPDWVTNADYDPKSLDVPGLKLLGERQEKFLKAWGEDWSGAEFKVALSQTLFSYATHISQGNRLLADLDSNGWPQSGRRRAVDLMRRCFAFHICGDQHLGCIAQYGVDDWRDASVAFCVPSIVNYYPRKWLPLDSATHPIAGAMPNLGDYTEGFGNKLTMFTYANPTAFPAPLTNLAASASGYGLVRFDKVTRQITIECWPRGVDVTKPGAKQYPGWPMTIAQEDNYGRAAAAWLPRIRCNVTNPVVQIVDEASGEIVYTLRIRGREFSPKVFHAGTYTLRVGEGARRKEFKSVTAKSEKDASALAVNL